MLAKLVEIAAPLKVVRNFCAELWRDAWVSVTDGPQPVHNPTIKSHIDPEELLSNQLYDLDPDVNVPEVPPKKLPALRPDITEEYVVLAASIEVE